MADKSIKPIKNLRPAENKPAADSKLIKHLAKQPLFQNAPDDVLAEIAGNVKILDLDKDDHILSAGEASHSLFIIRTGWVKVVANDDVGEEVILNHLGPGQIIGEMSLLDGKPRSSSVIVLRPATVMEIEYDAILDALNHHPDLATSLLQEMFNRVRFANAYIEETVEWCRYIAEGNYDVVQKQVERTQSTVVDMTKSDEARAGAFLSVFFKMVEGVKKREATLKEQVHLLTIKFDEAKREKSVQELTSTEFFEDLQEAAQRVREERQARLKGQSGHGKDATG